MMNCSNAISSKGLPALLGVALAAALALLPGTAVAATVTLAPEVAAQRIVQRGAPWTISGTATDSKPFTLEFLGRSQPVHPAAGNWSVTLDIPRDAPATAGLTLPGAPAAHQLAIGDIWLCSGQSNMALPVAKAADGAAIARDAAGRPLFLYQVAKPAPRPQPEAGRWFPASSANAQKFSALCLAFGNALHEQSGVPIGLIDASVGGTAIEAWISGPGFATITADDHEAAAAPSREKSGHRRAPRDGDRPAALFERMIKPLTARPIKGVLWYQGEGNRTNATEYDTLLATLIGDWRAHWRIPLLPFVVIQLPGYGPPATGLDEGSTWAAVRDAQRLATERTPATGLAVTIGLGDGTIHPPAKRPFALRAAAVANALTTTQKHANLNDHLSIRIEREAVTVVFDGGQGCVEGTRDLPGMVYLAGGDRRWHPAGVSLGRSTLTARSPQVPQPVAIRYAWLDHPAVGLRDCDNGVPVSPFRSDNWPLPLNGPRKK